MIIRLVGLTIALIIVKQVGVLALTNTNDELILEDGDNITLSGTIQKNVLIHIKEGSNIFIKPHDGSGENIGFLNLIAPTIIFEGDIEGNGIAYNERGKGGAPTEKLAGGGGAGHGGRGGRGDGPPDKSTGYGEGGPTYDRLYHVQTGSYGFNAGSGNKFSGFGGGAVRLDAIDLTIEGKADIVVEGNRNRYKGVGGGSGGTIMLDALSIRILGQQVEFDLRGGPGGFELPEKFASAGGGGGGGRFKIIQRGTFEDQGSDIKLNGGESGNDGDDDCEPGESGIYLALTSIPPPDNPELISPTNGDNEIGTQPTFQFTTHDETNFKFLKYQFIISTSRTFATIFHYSSQLNPDQGWKEVAFYASDELATYELPKSLSTSTTYYWSVSVSADNGLSWIDAGQPYQFTTTGGPNSKPYIPQVIYPVDQSINISKTPIFQIVGDDPDNDTLQFQITISQDNDLSNPQVFQASYQGWDQNSYTPAGLYQGVTANCEILNENPNLDALVPGVDYYYRVTVFDELQQSQDSAILKIITVERPTQPIILSPVINSTVTTKIPSLKFSSSNPTSSPLTYQLEISTDNFQVVSAYSPGAQGWNKAVYASQEEAVLTIPENNALISGVAYAFRVKAYDADNDNWSLFSLPHTFSVLTPPFRPDLISPENNYLAPDNQITFKLKATSEGGNTLTGKLEISENQFQSIQWSFDQQLNQSGWDRNYYYSNSTAAFTIPNGITFDRDKRYQWRASFFDGVSWGATSDYRSFTFAKSLSITESTLYPNPAVGQNKLTIYYRLSLDADMTSIIYNKVGKEIHQQTRPSQGGLDGNFMELDITSYAPLCLAGQGRQYATS